ncbi:MAG: YdeI/OmpD-associated family protein [Chitinophagaceae bacterium]|nr:YdeI/OmpD-associated family protein [Chitinophagaceae bacterium]
MITTYNGIPAFYAKNQQAWRKWLEKNHASQKAVWLIIYKKESGIPSIYYPEAVDEALCFGWIYSKPNKRDEESYYQFFSQRKPKSNSSAVNKKKVEKLLAENKIAKQYFEAFPPSTKKGIYEWIQNAKTPATREKRVAETVSKASQNIRANQYKQRK